MAFQIELNEEELSIQGVQFQTKKASGCVLYQILQENEPHYQ